MKERLCGRCQSYRILWKTGLGIRGFCYENGTPVYDDARCHNNKFKAKDEDKTD